eukprot:2208080-Amphidinium_carterae.1
MWQQGDTRDYITFHDLDPETDEAMSQLIKRLTEKYGNMLLAWMAIDKSGDGLLSEEEQRVAPLLCSALQNSHALGSTGCRLEYLQEFVAVCNDLGYIGDPKELWTPTQLSA